MPDDHPVHYYPVSRRERIAAKCIAALVVLLTLMCCGQLIRGIIAAVKAQELLPEGQFFSNSVRMDGTYDMTHATFSWTPALLPGYEIDQRYAPNVGSVRINLNTYIPVTSFYYDQLVGNWYFTATGMPQWVCGMPEVLLQPFLGVHNPITGAYDTIYGVTDVVSFEFCSKTFLPAVFR